MNGSIIHYMANYMFSKMANNSYCVFYFTPPRGVKLKICLAIFPFFLHYCIFCSNFAPNLYNAYALSCFWGLCCAAK